MNDVTPRRSRRSAREAGTRFETALAGYLAERLMDDRIVRRARTGAADRGDISGVHVWGQRLVIEAKNYGGRLALPEWLAEAEVEAGNDDALLGVVVAKRRGVADPGAQYVITTVDGLVSLLTGQTKGK